MQPAMDIRHSLAKNSAQHYSGWILFQARLCSRLERALKGDFLHAIRTLTPKSLSEFSSSDASLCSLAWRLTLWLAHRSSCGTSAASGLWVLAGHFRPKPDVPARTMILWFVYHAHVNNVDFNTLVASISLHVHVFPGSTVTNAVVSPPFAWQQSWPALVEEMASSLCKTILKARI
jgi:hypothetical protein